MSLDPKTYEEALEKARRAAAKRAAKPDRGPSKAATEGERRSRQKRNHVDAEEERWRRAVRRKYGSRCQFPGCGIYDKHIDCHHIAERSLRPDLKNVVSNGTCLCRTHHDWVPLHRAQAIALGLLSERTYELAQKEGTLGVR